ncbi:MAG: glycosyltransferase family 2 protein [Tannerella sp.]|nr:glycosyltransferase family 2 protein [Tannerella sp.]
MSLSTLSIIIPSYNEEDTILILLDKVLNVNLINDIRKEVIIIDDGSSDNTQTLINTFLKSYTGENIKFLSHKTNKGKGSAVRTGIKYISGDFVIIQDGDLECEPSDYNKLLQEMIDNDYSVIYGSRFLADKSNHLNLWFYLGGKIVTLTANILYRQNLTDEAACYKMFRTEFLKSIPLQCKKFEFCPEVTAKIAKRGIKIKEVPVQFYPRTISEGKKIRMKDGVEALWTLVKYRFIK